MGINFYSVKTDNSGAALDVSFSSKDESIWFKVIKQVGSTVKDGRRNGTFSGGATKNVKINIDEAGALIRAVRTNGGAQLYHTSPAGKTTVDFKFYEIDGKPVRRGFGLTISDGSTTWKVGLSEGAAENLSLYLQNALVHIYDAIYSADKKAYAERLAKKGQEPNQETPPKRDAEEEVADDADF